jgi:hypothetical protein
MGGRHVAARASPAGAVVERADLLACGGEDGVVVAADARSIDARSIDAPPVDAPPVDAPPSNCSISTPGFGALGALTGSAHFVSSESNPRLYRIFLPARLEAGAPSGVFTFEVYTGYEPFGTETNPTPVVPGTYPLTGAQLQYADCGVCLTMASNVAADGMSYDDDFMATGGTVTINTVDGRVGGVLDVAFANVTFEHVTFDGPTSTPVGDGCTTAITSASFHGVLAAPP